MYNMYLETTGNMDRFLHYQGNGSHLYEDSVPVK